MRVLFFSERAGVHERRFVAKLADSGQEVFYLPAFAGGAALLPLEVQALAPLASGKSAEDAFMAAALRSVWAQVRPDVVHAGPLNTCGYWAASAGIAPLLLMSWTFDLLAPTLSPEAQARSHFSLQHAQAAACDCAAVRREIVRVAPGLSRHTHLFPWGIELEQFHPRVARAGLRDALGWRDRRVVISVRSLEPLYGIETFISGALRAVQQCPELGFVVAGGGSLRHWAEEQVRAAGCEQSFHFLGLVPEAQLAGLYVEADAYVSCSRTDGTSISLLQAMACGLPAIVPEVGGNPEWVRTGENGWLFPVDDAAQLAATLLGFAATPTPRLKSMGDAAAAVARARGDWNRNIQVLLRAYEALAGRSDGAAAVR